MRKVIKEEDGGAVAGPSGVTQVSNVDAGKVDAYPIHRCPKQNDEWVELQEYSE